MGKRGRVTVVRGLAGCVLYMLVLVAVLATVAVCGGVLPMLPAELRAPVGGLGLLLAMAGTWAGMVAVIAIAARRRNRKLDAALTNVGPGKALSIIGRGWAGSLGSRDVNIWFNKGPTLEIYVSCDCQARVGVGADNAVFRLASSAMGRERVELENQLFASGNDLVWTRKLTDDAGAERAIYALMDEDGVSMRSINIEPEFVKLNLRYIPVDEITADNVEAWLNALDVIATTVEVLPAPSEVATANALVGRFRTNRGSLGRFFGITAISLTLIFGLLCGLSAVLMLILGI